MKRMTREISSMLYIFLPYLSSNLAGFLDTVEDVPRGLMGVHLEKAGHFSREAARVMLIAGRPALLVPCALPPLRPSEIL